ncbi:MAG TPA: hypothetical protein VN698_13895 [Bacteroidia bacterium]|nr:hypothetical protein [Bacteroidia bacterium]
MKKYIVYTESDYQINIVANNLREAVKFGRKACKRDKEVYHHTKLNKN